MKAAAAYLVRPKFLDAFSDRNFTSTTNNITNTDSGNRTDTRTDVMENVGNSTVNLGNQGGDTWLDKFLPILVIGALIIAGLEALRRSDA